jgi:hypothetical protein
MYLFCKNVYLLMPLLILMHKPVPYLFQNVLMSLPSEICVFKSPAFYLNEINKMLFLFYLKRTY